MKEEFLIPIDDSIEASHSHLNSHNRTILPARFGMKMQSWENSEFKAFTSYVI